MGNASATQESSDHEWLKLNRTDLIHPNLFPKTTNESNTRRYTYDLPCSADEFWNSVFTPSIDCAASKVGDAIPVGPQKEFTPRAEVIKRTADGKLQNFTKRNFEMFSAPPALFTSIFSWKPADDKDVSMVMHQVKGDQGYMEFAVAFSTELSDHVKIAGYAIVAEPTEDLQSAQLHAVVVVELLEMEEYGCMGGYAFATAESALTEYLFVRLEARFSQTVELFNLKARADTFEI